MAHIPWREIKSWRCVRCGNCCTQGLKVNLRTYEYSKLLNFWPESIQIGWPGDPFLKKINRRCVFYNKYGLCSLQQFNLKPFACKVWPFVVYLEPKSNDSDGARFYFENNQYFVYLNPCASSLCHGLDRGNPKELPYIINEILNVYKNPLRNQHYTSSKNF